MADTNFINQQTVVVADWLNDVNDAVYHAIGDGTNAPTTPAQVLANLGLTISGSTLLKGDGAGGLSTATGTDVTTLIAANPVTNATNVVAGGTIASTVTATTAAAGDNSTKVATTEYVDRTAALTFLPQGRLTLVSGAPVMEQDADYSSTTLYYAPYTGDKVPVYDGTSWAPYTFTSSATDLVGLSMSHTWATSSKFDVFITLSSGSPVLCTGPAWPANDTASRNLTKRNGIWTNSASITATFTGGTTATMAAYTGTWIGSINVGSVAGTLTATFTLGQNRRCDVWNLYNQEDVILGAGAPPTAPATLISWQPSNQYPAWQAYNNDSNNAAYYFTGLTQPVDIEYHQRCFVDSLNYGLCAAFVVICIDSITSTSNRGIAASFTSDDTSMAGGVTLIAKHYERATIGSHIAYMCGANANGTDGITMWSLTTDPTRYEGDAQTMWIKYKG